MGIEYFKRFRMEIDLEGLPIPEAELPEGYVWVAWQPALLERHAATKFASFRAEIDARVFPCLGEAAGCHRLMSEISQRDSFLPQATWLITHQQDDGQFEDCGTIQGIAYQWTWGAVQNVGVVPGHRGLGLGRALILKALRGFQDAGLPRAYLEVTAQNIPAVQLYRSVGFRLARTTYKAVEVPTDAISTF